MPEIDNEQLKKIIKDVLKEETQNFNRVDRYTFEKLIQILDGRNIQLGLTTGTKLGTATTQKLSFYNSTPIVQPTALTAEAAGSANSGDGATDTIIDTNKTRIGEIETKLQALGLLA